MLPSKLKLKNITKKFVGTVALKDVTVTLNDSEILAVLGENGAGKTTLMKILSGVHPDDSFEGEIIIEGKSHSFNSPKDSEKSGIAMIYQEINLELDLSIAENILLGRLPKKKSGLIDWKQTSQVAKKTLERLNVHGIDVNLPVRALNASMQQLVCIARALVRDPKILILDEPTSCLTEKETENLFVIIKQLKEQGISCLYISHKLEEVFALCDRIVILRDGNYISQYTKDNYDSEKIVEDIIGRQLNNLYPKVDKQIGEEVLRIENFKVQHPYAYGKNIIEDVSLTVRKGEVLGLCGLVGSGRSELLRAIFGVDQRLNGDVYIENKKINIKRTSDAKSLGLGLLTEDRKVDGFVGCLSIKENITLTVLNAIKTGLFIDRKKENKLVNEYFEKLKIKAPSVDTKILTLSGGNQQKVLLAKWLVTDLKVIFLDEPTRGIDVGTKAEFYKIIGELAAKGLGIIVISSELPELTGMCDRFVVLGKGKVLAEMDKDEADEAKIMHYASDL